jgi:serine/threonine protein kinase/WD40 repeat protein
MIASFQLIEKLGEGGMGVVYVAEQKAPLRRRVALKIIKPGMDSRQVIARFEAERQVLALMEHPNIARVLDAGTTEAGNPFFAMELVLGEPITDYCDHARLDPRARLRLFVTVCQAVQHAHQKGIIHRDLKPSNILVSVSDGVPVPKVIDFGVAKAVGSRRAEQATHTLFTQMIGTPLYMSPEQAGLGADVDTRSDVYSLGVLLYELLTGETPFSSAVLKQAGFDEMRRIICEQEPVLPSQRISTLSAEEGSTIARQRAVDQCRLTSLLRGELDWIISKALEKDPMRRYASASELAADIERHLSDLPIQARPPGIMLVARKWMRRRPASAVAIAACAVLLLGTIGGGYWHSQRLSASLAEATRLRIESEAREQLLKNELRCTDLTTARAAIVVNDYDGAASLLDRYRPSAKQSQDPGFAWHYLRHICSGPLDEWRQTSSELLTADVSPDGAFLVAGDRGGEVLIWNLLKRAEPTRLNYCDKEICSVRFSPDGKYLATAGQDTTIQIWETSTWTEAARLESHTRTICGVVWSPDGKWLASAGRDGRVVVWNIETRQVEHTLPHPDVVRCLAWSPDGHWLASDGGKEMFIWKTSDWSMYAAPAGLGDGASGILAATFSPNSELLAYAGYGGYVRLFDLAQKRERAGTMANQQIASLIFTGSGELVAGGFKGDLEVFEVPSGTGALATIRTFRTGSGTIRQIIAIPGDKRLWTASEEGRNIKVWNLSAITGRRERRFSRHLIDVLPALDLALISNDQESIIVEGVEDQQMKATLPAGSWHFSRACPQTNQVAIQAPDGRICLCDSATWRPARYLSAPPAPLNSLEFSGDGQWLAAGCRNGKCGAWNLKTASWHEGPEPDAEPYMTVAGSPLGDVFAFGGALTQQFWIGRFTGARPGSFSTGKASSEIAVLTISPDGQTLAIAQLDGQISLWSVSTGRPLGTLRGHTASVRAAAFSPDGSTLASVGDDHTVRLWHPQAQRELFMLARLERTPWWIEFLSERRLAVRTDWVAQLVIFDAGREE